MSNTYQRLPTDETPANPTDLGRPIDDAREPDPSHRPLRAAVQAEFNRPPPSWWKRAALILSMVLMTWLTFKLGGMGNSKPKVIYATRYSEEFKYRPAASPIITEHLKDGRIRIRGASVGGVGVREEDIPITPERKALEEKKRIQQAREAAKAKLKEQSKAAKAKRKARKGKGKGKTEI